MLLGLLLPPQHTSSSTAGAATATGRHLFAEGAYDLVMRMANSSSIAADDVGSSSSCSTTWSSSSTLSVMLLQLAAVWHAIMRAKARDYASPLDRYAQRNG